LEVAHESLETPSYTPYCYNHAVPPFRRAMLPELYPTLAIADLRSYHPTTSLFLHITCTTSIVAVECAKMVLHSY